MVSIIVPVYNVEQYLPECLSSILCQTYKDIEIILVNDGSTDRSGELCRVTAESDSRVILIEQKNAGLYCTHNGQVINADLNGAGNILRKAFPDIFKGADFSFLQDILVRNYRDLNKRIPVKGIGAA